MAKGISHITDKYLVRLDKFYGVQSTYHSNTGNTSVDIVTGDVALDYNDSSVVVRSSGLTSIELSALSNAGLGQVDAVWLMRSVYAANPKSDDLITIGTFTYEVVPQGVTLDDMGLLFTIMTRRRR